MRVMQEMNLEGKVAVVTGAVGLIGREHCRVLAEAGAHVFACDLPAALDKAPDTGFGPQARPFGLDVSDRDSITKLRDTIRAEHGAPDILVNNAAVNDMFENPALAAQQSMFEHYPLEMWQRSLEVNVTGVFLCSQILGTPMAERGKGSIINVASTYGIVGPDQSLYRDRDGNQIFYKSAAYPATKGAVINFTRFLAAYWGPAGVRVNTLSPGGVENNQDTWFIENYSRRTPLGRMAKPSDYRGALLFLASDASAYMTGANLVVDGGWTAW